MTVPSLPPIPDFDQWTDGAPLKPAALEWLNRLSSAYSDLRALALSNDAAVAQLQLPEEEGGLAQTDVSALRFIESYEFTGSEATADFTGFDSTKYDAYRFVLSNVIPATDDVNLLMRYSFDGGATFVSSTTYFYCGYANTVSTGANIAGSSQTGVVLITRVGSSTNEDGVSGDVLLPGPHLSRTTQSQHKMTAYDFANVWYNSNTYGLQTTRSPVDGVRFLFSSGNFESGKISMYGYANSAEI